MGRLDGGAAMTTTTPPKHKRTILQRSDWARLLVCDTCTSTPYALQTRQGPGADFFTTRFYADRDAAMWAYQQARKGTA